MASQHSAFAPRGQHAKQAVQQSAFAPVRQPQQQSRPAFSQVQPTAPQQRAPEFGTDAYYSYVQQQQQSGYVPNQGASNAQEAYKQQQEYMEKLKAQYDADNDRAKFNMTKEDAEKSKEQLDQMLDVLGSDADMTSSKPMLDTIDKFRWMISQVIESMRNPELWLPDAFVGNKKYVDGYKATGEKFATALEQYSSKLKLVQDKSVQTPTKTQ